jgi:hypothetical protein
MGRGVQREEADAGKIRAQKRFKMAKHHRARHTFRCPNFHEDRDGTFEHFLFKVRLADGCPDKCFGHLASPLGL